MNGNGLIDGLAKMESDVRKTLFTAQHDLSIVIGMLRHLETVGDQREQMMVLLLKAKDAVDRVVG